MFPSKTALLQIIEDQNDVTLTEILDEEFTKFIAEISKRPKNPTYISKELILKSKDIVDNETVIHNYFIKVAKDAFSKGFTIIYI